MKHPSGQIRSRPHTTDLPPKVVCWKGNGTRAISGKSRLVKYYSIWPDMSGVFGIRTHFPKKTKTKTSRMNHHDPKKPHTKKTTTNTLKRLFVLTEIYVSSRFFVCHHGRGAYSPTHLHPPQNRDKISEGSWF